MKNKQRIFIFLTHHNSGIPILPYMLMQERLEDISYPNLATYDINYLGFDYESYLVINDKVVLYNQDLLNNQSRLLEKEIRQSHNAPKLFRAKVFDSLIAHNANYYTYDIKVPKAKDFYMNKGNLCNKNC